MAPSNVLTTLGILFLVASAVCGWPMANRAKDVLVEIAWRDLSIQFALAAVLCCTDSMLIMSL